MTTALSNGVSSLSLTSSPTSSSPSTLRFAIPKGRMKDNVLKLLSDAGISITLSDRGYRPSINLPNYDIKLLKPQNIIEMLHAGSRDVGFGGADWVEELHATNLVELLDTRMDPVRVVAAGPSEEMLGTVQRERRHVTIASEYEGLTRGWIAKKGFECDLCEGRTERPSPSHLRTLTSSSTTPPPAVP